MSAVKNVIKNNFRNMELNEFLATSLKDAGYGGVEVQKTPVGARITVYVTRPGLVIGRKGTGIKDLMARLEQKFGLQNPQISVLEVTTPELNPNIMCNRIAQLIERGTAFRKAYDRSRAKERRCRRSYCTDRCDSCLDQNGPYGNTATNCVKSRIGARI